MAGTSDEREDVNEAEARAELAAAHGLVAEAELYLGVVAAFDAEGLAPFGARRSITPRPNLDRLGPSSLRPVLMEGEGHG
jgi:hypothetical protein